MSPAAQIPNFASKVTHAEAGQIIRDLDPDGEGGIDYHTFLEVLHAARNTKPDSGQQPHLVLNFDVNNTVVMLDSATGADSKGLISMVLSNSAWGTIDYDEVDRPIRWTLKASELSPSRPEMGLHTYSEFVVLQHPFPDRDAVKDKAELRALNEKVKANRRQALWSFTNPGMPGEVGVAPSKVTGTCIHFNIMPERPSRRTWLACKRSCCCLKKSEAHRHQRTQASMESRCNYCRRFCICFDCQPC